MGSQSSAPKRKKVRKALALKPPPIAPTQALRRQELIGVDEDGNMSLWDVGDVQPLTAFETEGGVSGHYVINWKGHAITAYLNGYGRINVQFMCSRRLRSRFSLPRGDVESMLLGKVIPDPEHEAKMSLMFELLAEGLYAKSRAPHRQRGRI